MREHRSKPQVPGEGAGGREEMNWLKKLLLIVFSIAGTVLIAWLFLKNVLPLVFLLLHQLLPYLA